MYALKIEYYLIKKYTGGSLVIKFQKYSTDGSSVLKFQKYAIMALNSNIKQNGPNVCLDTRLLILNIDTGLPLVCLWIEIKSFIDAKSNQE